MQSFCRSSLLRPQVNQQEQIPRGRQHMLRTLIIWGYFNSQGVGETFFGYARIVLYSSGDEKGHNYYFV